jgi:ribosomal protein S18 acetylase RimI-like enzyme
LIRPATGADAEAIGQLWADSARAAFTPLLPEGHRLPDPQPQRMRDRIAGGDVSVLVAEAAGELAGFVACGVSRDPDPDPGVGEVQSFFVGVGHWRHGIGRELMAAALADLRERGYTAATVWSFADNERANAFYEAHGFERDGEERTEEVWAHVPEVRYRRTLP